MSETIVTGKKYRILTDVAQKVWQRVSFWTKSSDVEFDDGKTAETKVGAISGITDSLVSTSSNIAASAKAVSELNGNLGGCSFLQEGNDFYIVGADSVQKKLGSNPYLLGSEYTENWGFNVTTHNRTPSSIGTYISTNEPIDITYVRKITAKLGIVNNGNAICYCGMGISKTQPTSFATAKANEIKEEFSSGMTGDISRLFELNVSGYSGKYYPFIYSNFPYNTGIYFWKIE